MTHPIVRTARGWIGTRFHHQGRLRKTGNHKGGVDCLGLLAGVAAELDLRGPGGMPLIAADETDYSHMPDAKRLYARLSELLIKIPSPVGGGLGWGLACSTVTECPPPNLPPMGGGTLMPGDIVLLRIDESPQHLAIVSDFSVIPALCGDLGQRTQALPCDSRYPHKAGMTGLGLIHAYAPARAVVEHALDGWWRERIEVAFRSPH